MVRKCTCTFDQAFEWNHDDNERKKRHQKPEAAAVVWSSHCHLKKHTHNFHLATNNIVDNVIRYSNVYCFITKYRSILNTGRQIHQCFLHTHNRTHMLIISKKKRAFSVCATFHLCSSHTLFQSHWVSVWLFLFGCFAFIFIDSYKLLCGAFSLLRYFHSRRDAKCLLKACKTKPFAIVISCIASSNERYGGGNFVVVLFLCWFLLSFMCHRNFIFYLLGNAYLDSWHPFHNDVYVNESDELFHCL